MFTNPFWTNFASMRPNLRFVGDGEQGGSGGGNGGTGDAGTGGAGDQGAAGAAGGTGDQGSTTETPEQTIARLTAERDTLAREKESVRIAKEGSIKAEARRVEVLNLAKALKVEGIEDNMSLEALTEKITGKALATPSDDQSGTAARKNSIESAVVREAWTKKVDPDKGDYLQFKVSQSPEFASLDPAAADFTAKISALVTATIENDPVFKAASGGQSGNGGGDHGGTGGVNEITQEKFDSMTIEEKTDLFRNNRSAFDRFVN